MVDPYDEAQVADWFAVVDARQRADRPDEPGWLLTELRAVLRHGAKPDADDRCVGLVAVAGVEVVSAGRLDIPVSDNTHLCEALILTHPERLRRGGGRALAVEVERRTREMGRTTLTATSEELPGEEGRSASRGFGAAMGYVAEQVEVRRDIDLPLDPAVVSGLAAVAAEHADDYDLRTWRDVVPDDLVEDQAYLHRRMSTDVPMAGMAGRRRSGTSRASGARSSWCARWAARTSLPRRSTGRPDAPWPTRPWASRSPLRSGSTSGTRSC